MTRYLTPSKIGLLMLVTTYCDGNVPNNSIVPVLSFVLSKLIPATASGPRNELSKNAPAGTGISIEDFENATRKQPSVMPGRNLFDLFVQALWSIDTLDALHEFFRELEDYLVPAERANQENVSRRTLLSRTSPLGIFFRQAQLEFARLNFSDAAALWTGLIKFRASTEAVWRKRTPAALRAVHEARKPYFDEAISQFDVYKPERLSVALYGVTDANALEEVGPSTDDVKRLLEFDLDKLQRFGSRVPKSMQEQVRRIISDGSDTPHVAYFVSFFDAWRAGDFTGAFENLHRYFDYTVRNRDKTFYQYALLHMAILQADFGCFDEAVAAMNETIATARENQDTSCLNFSLSWLSHLSKAHPKDMKKAGYAGMLGPEKDRLSFLSDKAKEARSWPLLSSTLLSEAKLTLSLGGDPANVSEYLYQSAHLNFVHHIFSNCGTQLLIDSAMNARTGSNVLADNDCEIILDCYADKSPIEDYIRACCRRAQGATQFGQYAKAETILESFSEEVLRTLKLNQFVSSYTGLIKLKQTLRRYDLVAAEHMLHQLKSGTWADPDIEYQIALLEIDYLAKRKSMAAAFDKLEQRLAEANNTQADIVQLITLLLIKADLYAAIGKAGKGFTIVLRAASMAYKHKLMPLLWEGLGALAHILTFFEEFEQAARILDALLPQALGAGDTAVAATLYSRQADAHMGMTSKTEAGSRQKASLLSKTDGHIDRAIALYEKLRDVRGQCESLAKKAIVARMRGDMKVADDWATKYLTLYEQSFGRKVENL